MTERQTETSSALISTEKPKLKTLGSRIDAYPLSVLVFAGVMAGVAFGTAGYFLFR
jgi:hypothetical protein